MAKSIQSVRRGRAVALLRWAMKAASVVVETTILKCHGPHPYAGKLPDRFGGRMHDAQVGFPVPFKCKPTGNVWRKETPPEISTTNGRLVIYAQCACGSVTEYEVVRSKDG